MAEIVYDWCSKCKNDLEYTEDQKEVTCPSCGTVFTVEFDLDADDYLFYYLIEKQ